MGVPPKITFVGAGSAVFARQIITDILAIEGLDRGEFALVDIDAERLELAQRIAERLIALTGKHWTVSASTDRCDVLAGSDFVVNTIEVAGLANVRHDYDIPSEVRGRPVHRRHDRPRRHLQGAAHRPGLAGDPARLRAALPRRLGAELHQSHVDPDPRRAAGHDHANGWPLPQRPEHLSQAGGVSGDAV